MAGVSSHGAPGTLSRFLCKHKNIRQSNGHNTVFSVGSFYPLHCGGCGATGAARQSGYAAFDAVA